MFTRHRFIVLAFLMIAVTGLTSCGKKSGLETPPDADPKHPRQYPAR